MEERVSQNFDIGPCFDLIKLTYIEEKIITLPIKTTQTSSNREKYTF